MTDLSSEGCLDCGRGLHLFCGEHECCKPEVITITATPPSKAPRSETIGRPIKENDDVQDKKSTGRKRAAMLYPINADKDCEWQKLVNCGGGKYQIIGCIDGKQQHRHHGPDKDTLNNAPNNVHRICDDCHNIWHSQNDRDYDPAIEHNPRSATHEELIDRAMKVKYCV